MPVDRMWSMRTSEDSAYVPDKTTHGSAHSAERSRRRTSGRFRKMRDTKGAFHAQTGTIKDSNGTALTEAEDITKRWQQCTEELYKKDLHDPDNHSDVITHLEPDILEYKVKWALGSITTNKGSRGKGITVELFQILKILL